MNKLFLLCLLIAGSSLFCTAKAFASETEAGSVTKFTQLWSKGGSKLTKIAPFSEQICVLLESMSYEQRSVIKDAIDPKNNDGTFDYCF